MEDKSETENGKSDNIKRIVGYDEAVELTGHGWYHILLLVACSLANFAVSMDMYGFSVVVATAKCDLDFDITTAGILNAAPLAGIVFAVPWGYFADTKGRRKTLLLSSSVGFVFSALSSFSPNWQTMFIMKLIGCSFSTTLNTLSMTYMGENIGGVRRRRYIFIVNSFCIAADSIYYVVAYFILPLDFLIPIPWLGISLRPWRVYTLILSIPLLFCALLLIPLYESPKLLVSVGKTDEAMEALTKMYEWNGGKKGEYPVKAVTLRNDEEVTNSTLTDFVNKQAVPLFKPPMLWRTLQLLYLMLVCGSTNNVVLLWYPIIVNLFVTSFNDGSFSSQDQSFCERIVTNTNTTGHFNELACDDTLSPYTIYAGAASGIVIAIMNLAASAVASYRRLVLIALFFLAGVCMVLVNIINQPMINLVTFTLIQCTAIGFGSVASYFVDLYPTCQRGLVSSLAFMCSRLGALAGVNVVGAVIMHYCTLNFYGSTIFVASGIAVALFLPPDKKQYK